MGKEISKNSTRSIMWDNLKGILIFLVVLGHLCLNLSIGKVIYTFHMPAFIFISGLLTSYLDDNSDVTSSKTKALRKYLIAFLLYNSSLIIFDVLTGKSVNPMAPLYSSWYLLALLVWRILTMVIRFNRKHLIFSILLALFIGFIPQFDNTFAISRIIAFAPFFIAGYLLDIDKINAFRNSFKTISQRILFGVFFLVTGIAIAMFMNFQMNLNLNQTLMLAYDTPIEALHRLLLFIIAALIILALCLITPDKEMILFTKAGKSSFSVFIFHRIPVLLLVFGMQTVCGNKEILLLCLSIVFAFALIYILSFSVFDKALNKLCLSDKNNGVIAPTCLCSIVLVSAVLVAMPNVLSYIDFHTNKEIVKSSSPYTLVNDKTPTLTDAQQNKLDNSYKILFTGDLLLLEDQVRLAYKDGAYDFSGMFEYTKPYIEDANLAIGVFEGPMAGEDKIYSTSNYADGKKVYLNFPDEFAEAVKLAGFDLVTIANNHMLDKDLDGAMRTMDVLDKLGLDYVGCYKSQEDKTQNSVRLITKDGIKFAVLSYTFGFNRQSEDMLWTQYGSLSSYLADPNSARFDEAKQLVKDDFDKAKSLNPDFIIVLPHMGTQFLDEPDTYQTTWVDIFKEYGADIILSDHTHSVQPVTLESIDGRDIFTAYCPGNYANIYREYNGDASIMVEVLIDPDTKTIIGGDIIPMWTTASLDGNYRPLPIYDIMTNENLRSTLTVDDLNLANIAHNHIANAVLGVDLDISSIRDRYYFNSNGYIRQSAAPIEFTEEMENGILYDKLINADSICFIGDSITCGSNNNGYSWYEPITSALETQVSEIAVGGITTKGILDILDQNSAAAADLYVIAIGTNDVRYRNESTCAMDSNAYVTNIDKIAKNLLAINPDAQLVFIAPWISFDGDRVAKCSYDEVQVLNKEYTDALANYCNSNNFCFINPNIYIANEIAHSSQKDFLVDWIHPNPLKGIYLYCEAVMLYK